MSDQEESCDIKSPPRKQTEMYRAQVAALDMTEGDERGRIFFGELAERKTLEKSTAEAWSNLEKSCCCGPDTIDAFQSVNRMKLQKQESKAFIGLCRFFENDCERIRNGFDDHSYVNFLPPAEDLLSMQYHRLHDSVTTGSSSPGTIGSDSPSRRSTAAVLNHPGRKRMSVALTSFNREVLDLQNVMQIFEEESSCRLAAVMSEIDERLTAVAAVCVPALSR